MTMTNTPLVYPKSRRGDQVDDYHGTRVADPYRWLEDPDSQESRAWIGAQNAVTDSYLSEIAARGSIQRRLTELWDYEKYSAPFKEGSRYFFLKNDGLQNQFVLYTMTSLDAEPRLLLDPNVLSEDGTVALTGLAISDDGGQLAYGISASGSDWQEWRVRDVEAATDTDDHLLWVKFSGASWTLDGAGFFYSRYDAPDESRMLEDANYFQKLYYHRAGTAQSEDMLVYERPDRREWMFDGHVTEDGRYLIISISEGTERKNRVYYRDLEGDAGPQHPVAALLDDFDAAYNFIGNDGPLFWFQTDLDAPRGRVIAIDTRSPERQHWHEVIPQAAETLETVSLVNNQFITTYLKDARSQVTVFDTRGVTVREVALPGIGTVQGFGGRRDDTETFYVFTSFTVPATIYRYDAITGASTIFRRPGVQFDPDMYETSQVFATGKDGTRVPMFITHKKGVALDGRNPTYLYGYGGFGISQTPAFSVSALVWMELGGVYAVTNSRGGGEYGEEWHQAGVKLRKQNTFDDFIAAAEWLIEHGYTTPPKLAIGGGSNGGLLVGACMTQRPDLFGAALPAVGVLDMLRFHKFTIGWAWTSDYGSPDDPKEFRAIHAYSPLHNLTPGTSYPATLITTADHDDRVVPAHSFKFAAALQAAHTGAAPTLIRIETKAGHGAGKPTAKVIEEAADRWAFLTRVLGMDEQIGG